MDNDELKEKFIRFLREQSKKNENKDGTNKFFKRAFWFSRCLRVLNVNKLGQDLIGYIQEETWGQYSSKWVNIGNYYEIDKKCFYSTKSNNGNKTKRAIENLKSLGLIEFKNSNGLKEDICIAIDFNTDNWILNEKQRKIIDIITNK